MKFIWKASDWDNVKSSVTVLSFPTLKCPIAHNAGKKTQHLSKVSPFLPRLTILGGIALTVTRNVQLPDDICVQVPQSCSHDQASDQANGPTLLTWLTFSSTSWTNKNWNYKLKWTDKRATLI